MRRLEDGRADYITVKELANRYRIGMTLAYKIARSLPGTVVLGRTLRIYRGDLIELEKRNDLERRNVNG